MGDPKTTQHRPQRIKLPAWEKRALKSVRLQCSVRLSTSCRVCPCVCVCVCLCVWGLYLDSYLRHLPHRFYCIWRYMGSIFTHHCCCYCSHYFAYIFLDETLMHAYIIFRHRKLNSVTVTSPMNLACALQYAQLSTSLSQTLKSTLFSEMWEICSKVWKTMYKAFNYQDINISNLTTSNIHTFHVPFLGSGGRDACSKRGLENSSFIGKQNPEGWDSAGG